MRRVPRLIGAMLAIPVLVEVYVAAAAARLRPAAASVLVVALLAGTIGAQGLMGGSAAAISPGSHGSLASVELRPVVLAPDRGARQPVGSPAGEPGPAVAAARRPAAAEPTLPPARVVRFRPRGGQSGIARQAQVSVRFTVPMDTKTRQAFRVAVNGSPVTGRYQWAEGDTVLVFTPSAPFPYGARVALTVTGDARSSDGTAIRTGRSVTFSVAPRPARKPASSAIASRLPSSKPPPASKPPATGSWRWPLRGPITQAFGQSLTRYGYHYGIDIDGRTGDPVRAARSGTVTVAGHYDSCSGLQVTVDHGGGFESWYRHLSRIEVGVGAHVTAGTIIGRVGATGCALGSHLHFAIRRNGVFVDPMRYLPRR